MLTEIESLLTAYPIISIDDSKACLDYSSPLIVEEKYPLLNSDEYKM